jgi:hypothetical protein
MITADRSTWPTATPDRPNAKLWQVAHAIAIAEGYYQPDSNLFRLNNPGDISDGYLTFGGEHHSGSNVTHFPDALTGWQWLYDKLNRIAQGKSSVYSPEMTWRELGEKWAGDSKDWVANVTRELEVDPQFSFGSYITNEPAL